MRVAFVQTLLACFCRRFGVAELWLFGSVVKGTETLQSDVDILVKFPPDSTTSTWDWPAMTDELRTIFGREVDLLSVGVLNNPFRRASILASQRLLFAA